MEKIFILIPAYNPDERLIELYEELKLHLPNNKIIIVNDGSNSCEIFEKLASVIHHKTNLGKGESLKTGFKYIIENHPECTGIVTADCDLQHSTEDICRIVKELYNKPDNLILGSRFSDKKFIPLRSKFGNIFVSLLMKFVHKIDIKDTQTGLRGISLNFAKNLLNSNLVDFSFETEMLIKAKKLNITIKEVPIKTIYIDKNKSSNFKPIKDSYKICKTILSTN